MEAYTFNGSLKFIPTLFKIIESSINNSSRYNLNGRIAVAPAPFEWSTFMLCIAGTSLLSGAAKCRKSIPRSPVRCSNVRTKHRVLVCGRLT
ncbi:sulfotransferase sult [Holotrichia oblita]|uniref:Sulfotransferase sult n=1 Tax=Holotrichia oblita TaxID=644536 RepID=A0ACB9T125_HOLOL|nr:sulfotransferase sult [Holotrichia oblita]